MMNSSHVCVLFLGLKTFGCVCRGVPPLTSWSGVGEQLSEPTECLRGVEAVRSPRAWDSGCPPGAGWVAGLSHWVAPVGMCQ